MLENAYAPENPTFSESLDLLEITDPGHADLFNKLYKKIFDNTLVLKKKVEASQNAEVFNTLSAAIEILNAAPIGTFKTGDDLLIVQSDVPDLWVTEISDQSTSYNYSNDDTTINDLMTNGTIQCGYYKVARLEIGKIDLSGIQNDISELQNQLSGVETALASI